jgi:hypothetical protein
MTLTLQDAAKHIAALTDFSRKTSEEVNLSFYEELGELCCEIKIHQKIAGTQHKKPGRDGIYGEAADLWICAVSKEWAQERILDWSPGPVSSSGYLASEVSQLMREINDSRPSMNAIEWTLVTIALYFDGNKDNFAKKIHEKLDKWERNVGFNK